MTRSVLLLLVLVTFACQQDEDRDDQEGGTAEADENRTGYSDASEPDCADADSRAADAGQLFEGTNQTSTDAGQPSVSGGALDGSSWDPCGDIEEIPVAWDELTDLQLSPEEVFGPIVGTCTTLLTWDSSELDTTLGSIVVIPPSGESEVTVTVEVDDQSIRYFRPTGEDAELNGCTGSLTVDASVSVQTEDGVFDDSADTTINYTPWDNIRPLTFARDLTELGGTLSVELSEVYEGGSLRYSLDGAGPSCSGEIEMRAPRPMVLPGGITLGGGGGGLLGTWSATDCPLGTTPFEVDPDAIEALLDNVSFPGVWDDGQEAELNVSIEVEVETSCAEVGNLINAQVPGYITYGTSDGRIKEHTIEIMLQVNYFDNGEIRGLACHVHDEMACDASDDVIDYTLNDCSALDSVMVQIGIHKYENETSFSDSGIEIYENHRGGTPIPGAADEVRYFNLEQES